MAGQGDTSSVDGTDSSRRPVAGRGSRLVRGTAVWLAGVGVHPNHVSVASVVFSAAAGASVLVGSEYGDLVLRLAFFVAAAAFVGGRAICNLLDGLMAVEGGLQTPSGAIFNEFPDRVSDAILLVCTGYAIGWTEWGMTAGWCAAVMALLVAYARTLGAASGAAHDFGGPMGKPHRMGVLVAAYLATPFETLFGWDGQIMLSGLVIIILGCLLTMVLRLRRIIRVLGQAQ